MYQYNYYYYVLTLKTTTTTSLELTVFGIDCGLLEVDCLVLKSPRLELTVFGVHSEHSFPAPAS